MDQINYIPLVNSRGTKYGIRRVNSRYHSATTQATSRAIISTKKTTQKATLCPSKPSRGWRTDELKLRYIRAYNSQQVSFSDYQFELEYKGCYQDHFMFSRRDLDGKSFTHLEPYNCGFWSCSFRALSLESCAHFCKDFKYFGLQNGYYYYKFVIK